MRTYTFRIIAVLLFFAITANCENIHKDATQNIRVGKYLIASEMLKKHLRTSQNDYDAILLLLNVAKITGDRRTVLTYRHLLKNLYSADKLNSAAGLTAYAKAVEDSDPKGALLLLDKAHKSDEKYIEAYIQAGNLCYERYAWGRATKEYSEVLKLVPANQEAMAGLAVLELSTGHTPQALKRLTKALKADPDSFDALIPFAYIAFLKNSYEDCEKILTKASQINPNSIDVHSLYAAMYDLKSNSTERDKYIKKALKVNPRCVDVYNSLSVSAEQKYRFKDAVQWAEKAIETDPDLWRGYYLAGNNLLRLGEEKRGYQLLNKSFEKNSFNVLAYNMLTVLDRDFKQHLVDTFETAHFAVKIAKQDSPVIWPYLKPLLEKTYSRFTKQFDIKPVGPEEHHGKILLHILSDHMGFSARIMGLPGISANGVCFGQVMLLPSPRYRSLGNTRGMNWKSIFEHEFLHILTLQKSDYKISRWLTEGISTEEESDLHGQWNRFFAMADKSDKLLPAEKLEAGFITPTYPLQVPVSYYQAAITYRYFKERYGSVAVAEMIADYKNGDTTEDVLKKISGKSLKELSKSLAKYYEKQWKAGQKFVNSFAAEITEAEKEFKLKNDNKKKKKKKLSRRNWEDLVEYWCKHNETDRAAKLLNKLLTFDDSDFKIFKTLGEIYCDQKEWAKGADILLKATYRNPFDLQVHQMAAKCYKQLKMEKELKREKKVIVYLSSR